MSTGAARVRSEQPPVRRPSLRVVRTTPRAPADVAVAAERWQLALDSAQRALLSAAPLLAQGAVSTRQRELTAERRVTAVMLRELARETGARPAPWLSSVPIEARMLGLPSGVQACLFDLDGVLTDSGALHAWAWGEVFDPLLLRLSERAGWAFRPFDRVLDYRDFVDGRPRLEGIHTFLASRGLRLPEGRSEDAASADTAWGLARRKGEKLVQGLAHRGVGALPGARRYLEAARRAGLGCAVVSASTTTRPMLELAGLNRLLDERADAEMMLAEALRARPAPDLLLAACRRFGVAPAEAVTLTHSAAGVAAGRSAGLVVIGVGGGERAEDLREFGAEVVVPTLSELLDPPLRGDP